MDRLELAIKYTQKDVSIYVHLIIAAGPMSLLRSFCIDMQFVAHPNVQQLLGAIWYQGLPCFRRRSPIGQIVETLKIAMQFPIYSMLYMIAPTTEKGKFIKKPFVKFICHSASYLFFLCMI